MNIQLNTLKNLNEKIKTDFFMNRDNLDYHSIKTLKIIFASLLRSVLFYIFITFALNIELIKSMQFKIFSVTANHMKNCISQFVNKFEAKLALNIRDSKNSKIYEEYRLTSELLNKFTLNMLQKKFIEKMNNRGFT